MKKLLIALFLIGPILTGCSGSVNSDAAGKYSRTSVEFNNDGKIVGKYKNTTELKSDGTYSLSTDRKGEFKILETGTYVIEGDTITFQAETGRNPGEVVTRTFDGKSIAPDKFFKRTKE